jgi:hypothetical protein
MNNNISSSNTGEKVFLDFIKQVNKQNTLEFDYFHFLEHLSTNKIDKDGILNLLKESI